MSLLEDEDRARLPAGVEDAYPLVELQAGMLFHSALSPETAVYHDVFAARLTAELDEPRLRRRCGRLMRRHAVLRTRFALERFYAAAATGRTRRSPRRWRCHDLSAVGGAEQEAALAAWLEREKARPFDFTVAPLFRLVVHRLSARRFQLALSFHHAILDGWSVATLLAELFTEYENEGSGVRVQDSAADVSGLCGVGAGGLGVAGSGRVLGSVIGRTARRKNCRGRRGPREVHCRAGWASSRRRSTPRWRRS